jgi:ATP-dependent Clp protease protease subunit
VYVEGIIGEKDGTTAASFREQLARCKDAKTLRVHFNSDGGVVTEGTNMYNALRAFPGEKIGIVEGIAASIASVVLMACDEIKVAKGAYIMIHNPSGGVIRGGADDLRGAAEALDKMRGDILDIYEARTGIERTKLEKLVDAETYFTAEEAVAEGFADAIEDYEARISLRAVARLDPGKMPDALRRMRNVAPMREELRARESIVGAALREAAASGTYPYLVDLFEDRVVFELDGVLFSQGYTVKEGVAKLSGDAERVVRTYEKVSASLRAAAKGKNMSAKKKAKLEAQIKALQEEMAKCESETETDEDEETEEEEDEEEEEEKPKDTEEKPHNQEDATACLELVRAITGESDLALASGKLAAIASSGAAAATSDRAAMVSAAIKAGKLAPALKGWALKASDKAFTRMLKAMGGASALKLGRRHEPPANPEAPAAQLTKAERLVAQQMRVSEKDMIESRGKKPPESTLGREEE